MLTPHGHPVMQKELAVILMKGGSEADRSDVDHEPQLAFLVSFCTLLATCPLHMQDAV